MLQEPANPRLVLCLTCAFNHGIDVSKLAVALAERYNGEIINGDALQMYDGLPVVTNKIPVEERRSIPHHLLGCVNLDDEPWSVGKFKDKAVKIIEEIRSRGKVPILVGGTHYYTQSLLFKDFMIEDESKGDTNIPTKSQEEIWPILVASTEEMLSELEKVDPIMAARWHPKDRRRIRRSLEIWYMIGRRASDIYNEQKAQRTVSTIDLNLDDGVLNNNAVSSTRHFLVSPLRYDSLVLWTYSAGAELKSRLDERVDTMLDNGLIPEVRSMHALIRDLKSENRSPDITKGIWIAIGYKEFVPYLKAQQNPRTSPKSCEPLKLEGIAKTKDHIRQYAKRQVRWIRLKLIHALQFSNLTRSLFLLNTSDLSVWSHDVEGRAGELVSAFIAGEPLPDPISLSQAAETMLQPSKKEEMFARYCKACAKTLMTESEWERHLRSKKHKKGRRTEYKKERSLSASGNRPTHTHDSD